MESKVAKDVERALVDATQRLSPEDRVRAFLTHSRLVVKLHNAGQRLRAGGQPKQL